MAIQLLPGIQGCAKMPTEMLGVCFVFVFNSGRLSIYMFAVL